MTADSEWQDGEMREVQWLPQGDPIPADAIDHGLAPGHHAAHSRLIETGTMSRTDTTVEELPEPSLVYLRRPLLGDPISLVIVENGKTTIRTISNARVLRMVADGAGFLAGSSGR